MPRHRGSAKPSTGRSPGPLAVVPVQPPPQYVLALAWRRGEHAAAAHRFLGYLRCYRDRHQWITGLQVAAAHYRDPGLTISADKFGSCPAVHDAADASSHVRAIATDPLERSSAVVKRSSS